MYSGEMEEILPLSLREAYMLPSIGEALEMVHFPKSPNYVKQARRRFVYEELLKFQLKMVGIKKIRKENEKGTPIHNDLDRLK
ncbi:hypothetical protein, partial [Escherichia coli]|uniref:hypothetical protein n=1 Tax=Escherichia coli TaxID=562 RepID=UPI001CCDC154